MPLKDPNSVFTAPFRLPPPPASIKTHPVVPRYALEPQNTFSSVIPELPAPAAAVAAEVDDTSGLEIRVSDLEAAIAGFSITPTCNEDGTLSIEWSFG